MPRAPREPAGMPRRPRPSLRPALPRRAIVWFPPAEMLVAVEAFRTRCDPLAAAIPAHVTLVFPFASTLTPLQIAAHVRRVVAGWPALPVRMEGADALLGQWVNLRLALGRAAVVELHDRLYRGALAPFLRAEFGFDPHLTVGVAGTATECGEMLEAARAALPGPIDAVLDALSICTFARDGRVVHRRDVAFG
jgi:2'-5' RNA ligase